MSATFEINGQSIAPGTRATVELPVPQLYTHTPFTMPIQVFRGRRDGARLFVSAAIHGDELNGVEIIRRLLKRVSLSRLRGTLVTIPIVNVYGVLQHSRYLPDRRDLNRSFPGSERGSLAARLADRFMNEIVANCTHGVDLHTGALHRTNLPQIRAQLADPETLRLAQSFGLPVLLNSDIRDGSLRGATAGYGIPMLVYEAGEALRFDEFAIRPGVQGLLNVMRALEMLPPSRARRRAAVASEIANSSAWVRAPESGIFRSSVALGTRVKRDESIGLIADPFGHEESAVHTPYGGIVIGKSQLPIVHQGDALFHVARFDDVKEVAASVEAFQATHEEPDSNLDDPDPG